MKIFKIIFYLTLLIGSFFVAKDNAYPATEKSAFMIMVAILSIFYWLYKIIKVLIHYAESNDIIDNADCCYGKYGSKISSTKQKKKPSKTEIKKAEAIGEKLKINTNIKIITLKRN